jgi:hypothetical protein
MKYFYFAVTIEENKKYYSYIVKTASYDNLLSTLKIKNIISANIYPSKKKATEIVNHWNACYKANGNYLFDYPLF